MTYEEFLEALRNAVKTRLGYTDEEINLYPKGYQSKEMEKDIRYYNQRFFNEDTDTLLNDVMVLMRKCSKSVESTFSFLPRNLYDLYKKDGFESAFKGIQEHEDGINLVDCCVIENRVNGSYEKIRNQLILRPMNVKSLNDYPSEECVYDQIGDVVLVLYQVLDESKVFISSRINAKELQKWNVNKEKALKDAMENTRKRYPAVTYNFKLDRNVSILEENFRKQDVMHNRYILLTTEKGVNGAISVFYPGVREKMMQVMGGPYGVVFMNTVDALIFKAGSKEIPLAMNLAKKGTGIGNFLSDQCFICDEKGIRPFMS